MDLKRRAAVRVLLGLISHLNAIIAIDRAIRPRMRATFIRYAPPGGAGKSPSRRRIFATLCDTAAA